ncbi:TonB-dependent receptor [Sphingobium fluviale]|uniref:TonB-dependent receptor n=2 Tax=Sphingobium fluviale TaxID=2506423 RepID=A0A4Q1KJS6_9SPHN|nr:TonB-dependent receptor [Sphingobium fluviale]
MPFMRPLLLPASLLVASFVPAVAQGQAQKPQVDDQAEEEIVVTASSRLPGGALGEIKPEVSLGAADVRALGVSSVTEILAELAPQIRGTGGGQPLILLEGRRVSGRQEIERIPSEAIARVDVLPEQVALKYGYPADQKVVNFVLRKRFRAWTLDGRQRFATEGGGGRTNAEASYFSVRDGARFNLSAEYIDTAMLTEAERGLAAAGGASGRSLIASRREFEANVAYHRPLSERLDASVNGVLSSDESRALTGAIGAQTRTTSSQTAHLGTTMNLDVARWRGTWTSAYDHSESRAISTVIAPGQPADQARSNNDLLVSDISINGPVARLPAGEVSLTARAGGTLSRYDSQSLRAANQQSASLKRTSGLGSLSLDVPVLDSPTRWIGDLSLNANVQGETLSDFGTVRGFGGGFSWAPIKTVSLVGSYKDAQSAPTVQQLGDPQIITDSVRYFDYVRGESRLVRLTSGGNPALDKAQVREWRLGLNVKAMDKPNLSLSLDYTRKRTENGIVALPTLTAASLAAYPGRFNFDPSGALIGVDARAVNIAEQQSDVLRWGINFSKSLKTPQAQIDAIRSYMAQRFPGGPPGVEQGGSLGAGAAAAPGGGPARGGGGFGGRGGAAGGRLSFSLYHSIHLTETATLIAGQPQIDLLNGGTLNGGAPQPRHEVEATAGYNRGWLGGRLTANWQSSAQVRDPGGAPTGNLRFDDLTKVNLRMFINVGQIPSVLRNHPWLFGTRIGVGVGNIFNARQKVTDGTGATPPAYSGAQLDPLGRTITISVRKLLF